MKLNQTSTRIATVALFAGTGAVVTTVSASATPPPVTTVYQNIINDHSGKCVTVAAATNAKAAQFTCKNRSGQQWTQIATGRGFVEFKVANNGQCLEVANSSQGNNVRVQAARCTGGFNQQWSVQNDGRITARHSGKCLSVQSESLLENADVVQYTCDGGFAENWHIS
jgi:hypothetical protein